MPELKLACLPNLVLTSEKPPRAHFYTDSGDLRVLRAVPKRGLTKVGVCGNCGGFQVQGNYQNVRKFTRIFGRGSPKVG